MSQVALLALAALLGAWLVWLLRRPNRARVDPRLAVESWSVVADGAHHSNTDMIAWRGTLLLVHASSPWHLGSRRSQLSLRSSSDGRRFERLASLRIPGHDVRDPKLVEIGGQLFLYALRNDGLFARPAATVVATSSDGRSWSGFEPVGPPGWLFWRPKSRDGRTWYAPAYWHAHGASILLRSEDGRRWERVSEIHRGEGDDETAIEFLSDGRLLATARLEVTPDAFFGHRDAATALSVAEPPYARWRQTARSSLTRLDGPALFRVGERIFAVGRFQPGPRRRWTRLGSVTSRKRTSLFRVEPERLVWLSDLPSAGDTSYAGVVVRDGELFVDYYTSRVDRDVPWLFGMFLPSEIRIARLSLEALERVSDATP